MKGLSLEIRIGKADALDAAESKISLFAKREQAASPGSETSAC